MSLQMARYGLVGVLATLVHFSVVVMLVELLHMDPVISNVPAFFTGFLVSYYSNRSWTFAGSGGRSGCLPKYLLVQIVGLGLNLGIMFLTVNVLKWSYIVGLCLALLCAALVTFLLNKYWTFLPATVGLAKR